MLIPEVLRNDAITGVIHMGNVFDKDKAYYMKYFSLAHVLFLPVQATRRSQNSKDKYNFLFLRGSLNEHDILSKSLLGSFDFIYCMIDPFSFNNIDKLLEKEGFFREETIMTVEKWGEAFYKRLRRS